MTNFVDRDQINKHDTCEEYKWCAQKSFCPAHSVKNQQTYFDCNFVTIVYNGLFETRRPMITGVGEVMTKSI